MFRGADNVLYGGAVRGCDVTGAEWGNCVTFSCGEWLLTCIYGENFADSNVTNVTGVTKVNLCDLGFGSCIRVFSQ